MRRDHVAHGRVITQGTTRLGRLAGPVGHGHVGSQYVAVCRVRRVMVVDRSVVWSNLASTARRADAGCCRREGERIENGMNSSSGERWDLGQLLGSRRAGSPHTRTTKLQGCCEARSLSLTPSLSRRMSIARPSPSAHRARPLEVAHCIRLQRCIPPTWHAHCAVLQP